jgi:glycosyltransferase involved in cell wall biosynthesis
MKKKAVEIVIPIYNEEVELTDSIKKLHSFLKKHVTKYTWHITIADNASKDNSVKIAKSLSKKLSHVGLISLPLKGRGRAVKRAWKESRADALVYMDVDLSTDLSSLNPLLDSLLKDGYNIAIGSRLLPHSKVIGRPIKREILSRGYNILMKLLFQVKFSDAQCGFKGITKQTLKSLIPRIKDNEWFFDSELLIVGEKMGYKIFQEPVRWVDNPGSTVRVLKTVTGDLKGLYRLLKTQPWKKGSR